MIKEIRLWLHLVCAFCAPFISLICMVKHEWEPAIYWMLVTIYVELTKPDEI